MTKPIITIHNIGKKYRLGHVLPYYSLRDTLSHLMQFPFGRHQQASADSSGSEFWAIKNISFTVEPGEILGIIGRNGAGKSTLLKILSRITAPTTGEITVRGRIASLLEVGTGFHPELTGRENIFLNGAILGMTRNEINRKLDEIVAFSEIDRYIDTPVKFYSSGMYTRLAFAVAAHLEPEILIIDEVLAVGDAAFQKKCLGKMDDVARQGRTVLFVSHNMAAVKRLVQRCILLEKGKIVAEGNSQKVIDTYLERSMTSGGIMEFPTDEKKYAQITRLSVSNSQGETVSVLDPASDVVIDMDLIIRDKSHGAFDILVVLAGSDGTVLWYWNTREDPKIAEKIKVGHHRMRVSFPGHVLNCGRYIIRGAIGLNSKAHFNHPNFGDGIMIELTQDSEIGSLGYNMTAKEGILSVPPKSVIWEKQKTV